MRLLLDTHILLWALIEPLRLDRQTRGAIEDASNQVVFSTASIWEIAIKSRLGRNDFAFQPAPIAQAALDSGFSELPISCAAAARVADLPPLHRDPFDRLLIAQALIESVVLYTADQRLPPYSERVRLVTPQ